MKKYEDVYIVTDTKDMDSDDVVRDFQMILDAAEKTDSMEVLDRLVVQLYNHDMFDAVESIHHFPNYILTLYRIGGYDGPEFIDHCRFCKNKGVRGITMWEDCTNENNLSIVKRYGLDIYVHTVNSMEVVEQDASRGVKGFYTDFIYPDMLVTE